jgi:hypothetical protein
MKFGAKTIRTVSYFLTSKIQMPDPAGGVEAMVMCTSALWVTGIFVLIFAHDGKAVAWF